MQTTKIAVALCLATSSMGLVAQTPVNQLERTQNRAASQEMLKSTMDESVPSVMEGEDADTGPQYILKVKKSRKYFDLLLDSQIFYTSNMFFEEDGTDPEDTSLFVNTIQLALAPGAYEVGNGRLSPRVGIRHQWFNYGLGETDDTLNDSDFNVQTLFTDVRYRFWEHWTAEAGFEFSRLMETIEFDEFYKEYQPFWGMYRLIPLSDRARLSVGYQGNYRITDADPGSDHSNDRTDHAIVFGATFSVTDQFYIQPVVRSQYSVFTRVDREDWVNTLGISFNYAFNEFCIVRLMVSYDFRESNNTAVSDYQKFDGGVGLNLNFRF